MNIKQFIASQPERLTRHICGSLAPDIDIRTLSGPEKNALAGSTSHDIVIRTDGGTLFAGERSLTVRRVGRNVFLKKEWMSSISFRDGKLSARGLTSDNIRRYLDTFGITWCRDLAGIEMHFVSRPAILKKVLAGSVYSQETLWKAVLSVCFHAKSFPWRTARDFFRTQWQWPLNGFSFVDLLAFTRNPQRSVSRLIELNGRSDTDTIQLLRDLLKSAVDLDETVDFAWSPRRAREEHSRQIRELARKRLDNASDDEIQETRVDGDSIRMLNTEKEVFIEGNEMSHCLFTNYLRDIKDKVLLAFHMSSPEDCTFSVEKDGNGHPRLQQIYLSHNRRVQDSTRDKALGFIYANAGTLEPLLCGSRTDDLPF